MLQDTDWFSLWDLDVTSGQKETDSVVPYFEIMYVFLNIQKEAIFQMRSAH